ncbi:hypothetical protein LCGC14_2295660 [marine sediment metagenome]|uniref:Uncharacterized protein n=1 Tax=marine sediment metagenome TaxID=412755 RepID=A0A0F9F2F7_9ZZZZ
MAEYIKCIRCGVCCIQAPACMGGSTDDTKSGLCSYLTIHKDGHTSCKGHTPVMNSGCTLRHLGEMYEDYKDRAEQKAGVKLTGIIE